MKLETKTSWNILTEEISAILSMQKKVNNPDKKWTSNESLVPILEEALSKTADSSKVVAVKRILKELEEK